MHAEDDSCSLSQFEYLRRCGHLLRHANDGSTYARARKPTERIMKREAERDFHRDNGC